MKLKGFITAIALSALSRKSLHRHLVPLLSFAVLAIVSTSMWGAPAVKSQSSCDGNFIAYSLLSDTEGTFNFYLTRPDGTGMFRVRGFQDSSGDRFGAASPNGDFIVFSSFHDPEFEESSRNIFRAKPDGTGVTNLSNNQGGNDHSPTISPDGTKIAYVGQHSDIYVMNADGTGRVQLTSTAESDVNFFDAPSFSPDSSKLVFEADRYSTTANDSIFTVNIDGTDLRKITLDPESGDVRVVATPRFSADGTLVYYLSTPGEFGGSFMRLYAISSEGSIPAELTDEGQVESFEISPDGNKIAYGVTHVPGDLLGEIFVMNSNGSNKVNITNRPGVDLDPIFSPDGTRIAFVSDSESSGGALALHVMNVDGSGVSPRLSLGSIQVSLGGFFIPDSDLDNVPDPCDNCLSVSNPGQGDNDQDGMGNDCDADDENDGVPDDNDNCRLVTNPDQLNTDGDANGNACDNDDDNDGVFDQRDNCPLIPNGEKILFSSQRGSNTDIYSVNNDGTGAQPNLTNSIGSDGAPSYSKGANRIAFESTRDGNLEIYTMNPDGSNVTRLTNNTAIDGNPDFSEDGTRIVFQSNRGGDTEIYVMNADGTGQTALTNTPPAFNTTGLSFHPAFSPDGTRIAFSSDRDTVSTGTGKNEEIYVMNADGTGVVRLTNALRADIAPDFSPDGSQIVFRSTRDGSNVAEIYVMSSNGSPGFRLTETGNNNSPVFSPDGSQIAFISSREGSADHIFVMTAVGTVETRLFQNSATESSPAYLPQLDSDGDGVGDACDTGNTDSDTDGIYDDIDNCLQVPNPDQQDTDGDGQGDPCDPDDDNDTVPDDADNCKLVPNTDQTDSDGEGQGNACDLDDDNDGILDGADNCSLVANVNQSNNDGDQLGDVCDLDDDNDDVPDLSDNCPLVANQNQADSDSDGIGDACDVVDADGDGAPDTADNCRLTANANQADSDSDGVGDACDNANLRITKLDSENSVLVGGNFTYIINVKNLGPTAAENIVMTDPLLAGLTLNSISIGNTVGVPAGGVSCIYDAPSHAVTCNITAMSKLGETTINLNVTGAQAGKYINTATVSALSTDPNLVNNTAKQTTHVVTVKSITITPAKVTGGGCQEPTLTVNLTGPAPAGGVNVLIFDDLDATTNVPGSNAPLSLNVPAAATKQTFVIATSTVATAEDGIVTATLGSVSVTDTLTVRPIGVASVTLNPTSVQGGGTSDGLVTLDCVAPAGGVSVTITSTSANVAQLKETASSSPAASITITIPQGTTFGNFIVQTSAVSATKSPTVKATANGLSKSARLTVTP